MATTRWASPLLAALLSTQSAFAASVLHVNSGDPSCGGAAPCFTTVQAAVAAAGPGDVVRLQEGVYPERVRISGKSDLVVEGDPALPPGRAAIRPPAQPALEDCLSGIAAIEVADSSGITLRRLLVTGYEGYGIRLSGAPAARVVGTRVVGNGRPECGGGVAVEGGSPGTLLAHNLIHGNHRDGVVLRGGSTPEAAETRYLWSNTIHGNARHGVRVAGIDQPLLWNNLIVGNGSDGSLEPSFGVVRDLTGITAPLAGSEMGLWHNLVCGNRTGEVFPGPLEEPTASGNQTPSGDEGPGYAPSPGCGDPTALFEKGPGRDATWGTPDDDFFLKGTSPAVGAGYATLPSGLDPGILREDFYEGRTVRPADAGDGAFTYDVGALEWGPRTRRNVMPHLLRVRRVPESLWLE